MDKDDDIISLEDYKLLKDKVSGFIPEADLKSIVKKLINVTIDLTLHLQEAKEEITKLKKRQLQLATWVKERD